MTGSVKKYGSDTKLLDSVNILTYLLDKNNRQKVNLPSNQFAIVNPKRMI